MALVQVNPTRMELNKLKKRLNVARRGHKLLKDKRDELMKKFLDIIKKNKSLREEVEKQLAEIYDKFLLARSVLDSRIIDYSLMFPLHTLNIEVEKKNIMSVEVPVFKLKLDEFNEYNFDDAYSYGLVDTTETLDSSIGNINKIFPLMLDLAQTEKTAQLLAEEIEKVRRRVNALEYVMIPKITSTIKYIIMKLDESERGNLTRLMKVKEMMIEELRKSNN